MHSLTRGSRVVDVTAFDTARLQTSWDLVAQHGDQVPLLFVDATVDGLLEAGVPARRVRYEHFDKGGGGR